MEKTLGNTDVNGAHKNVPDIQVFGDGDMFQLLSKASSQAEGWMKSTKAMEIPEVGCLVQVTTQQRSPDGSYAVAEAVTFVPGVGIKTGRDPDTGDALWRELVPIARAIVESSDDEYWKERHTRSETMEMFRLEIIGIGEARAMLGIDPLD